MRGVRPRWLALCVMMTLVVAGAAAALTASASSRVAMKTYVGQTAYQRARQQEQNRAPGGRKLPSSAFQMTMKVSHRGIEVVEGMDGPCGSVLFHAPGTKSPAWPVRNGRFNHIINNSPGTPGYVRGRVTAKKITGSFSFDSSKICPTSFTLKAR